MDSLWPEVRDALRERARRCRQPIRRQDAAPGELRVRISRPEGNPPRPSPRCVSWPHRWSGLTGVGSPSLDVRGRTTWWIVTLSAEAEREATDNRTMAAIGRDRAPPRSTRLARGNPPIQRQGRDRIPDPGARHRLGAGAEGPDRDDRAADLSPGGAARGGCRCGRREPADPAALDGRGGGLLRAGTDAGGGRGTTLSTVSRPSTSKAASLR